jgi:hypothetical protein
MDYREPGAKSIWEVPLVYTQMVQERQQAIRFLKSTYLSPQEQTMIKDKIALCDYALMSSFIYDYAENPTLRIADWFVSSDKGICSLWKLNPETMRQLQILLNPGNGMRGELFFPTRKPEGYKAKPILAFKGTGGFVTNTDGTVQPTFRIDLVEIAECAFGHQTAYLEQAQRIADQLMKLPSDFDFVIVGHSLGGKLAAAVSRMTGKLAFTFNAAGFNEQLLTRRIPTSHICNYVIKGELITSLQEEIEDMRQKGCLKTFIADLLAIIQVVKSSEIHFLERWKTLECTEEYSLLLFLISHLKDQELPIPVAVKDSVSPINPNLDGAEGNFETVPTDKNEYGGVLHLVGCLAKLVQNVQLFTSLQFQPTWLNIPRGRLSFGDWFGRVSQGMGDVIDAVRNFDWRLIGRCACALKLHRMEVVCPSFRFQLKEQIRAIKEAVHQHLHDREPGLVCLIGPASGGKTTIWNKIQSKVVQTKSSTLGVWFSPLLDEMKNGCRISLQFADFQSDIRTHFTEVLGKAAVIFLVLDGTVQNSHTYLNQLEFLIEDRPGRGVSKLNKDTRFVIAVNKFDLPQVLTPQNITNLAMKLNCGDRVFRISAREGGDTFQAFISTCANLVSEYNDPSKLPLRSEL